LRTESLCRSGGACSRCSGNWRGNSCTSSSSSSSSFLRKLTFPPLRPNYECRRA
uniref:Polyprotein n=1 Tax=Gongylonema pulchrum TaxID=637853 RepID=A0A183D7X9_9BILA